MPSQLDEFESAEDRFRKAFERLKEGNPRVLKRGAPLTQNNVAREAGCDPSALKKTRFPSLIRQIQAYLEIHRNDQSAVGSQTKRKRTANRSIKERLDDTVRQRDHAQSVLASANERIVELTEEVQSLRRQLNEAVVSPAHKTNLIPVNSDR